LAGLTVGFAVGHPDLIEALERIKNSFNSYPLDRLAITGAAAAFEDREYFEKTCRQVIDSLESVVTWLQALGFEVLPSAANFVFARHPHKDAATLAAGLREQGVRVRHFKQARIAQFLRIGSVHRSRTRHCWMPWPACSNRMAPSRRNRNRHRLFIARVTRGELRRERSAK
jgi:histidinol-phosphate aminotransferase